MDNRERFILSLNAILVLFPLAWVSMLWSASYRASQHIGRFPIPGRDDPKWIAPNDKFYHGMLDALWHWQLIVGMAALMGFVLLCVNLPKHLERKRYGIILLLLLPVALLLTTIFLDPGRRVEWFID